MNSRFVGALLSIILIAGVVSALTDESVFRSFESNDEIAVLVELNPGYSVTALVPSTRETAQDRFLHTRIQQKFVGKNKDVKIVRNFDIVPLVSVNLSKKGLSELAVNPAVKSISLDLPVHAHTQQSIPLIGANQVHQLQFQGQNITGNGQTICVIDTGIDYSHESLGSCSARNETLVNYREPLVVPPSNDSLAFSTGEQNFPVTTTDTITTGQSYVRVTSSLTAPFDFGTTQTNTVYIVTDSVSAGNSTQGLLFYQEPTTGLFVPVFDSNALANVTYETNHTFDLFDGYDVYLYNDSAQDCFFANGTHLYGLDSSYSKSLQPASNITFTDVRPTIEGLFSTSLTQNVSVTANSLNASCTSGNVTLSFENSYNWIYPGLGAPGVTYALANNYVSYQYGSGSVDFRIHPPGFESGLTNPDFTDAAIWVPEYLTGQSGIQGAFGLDVGYADQSAPRLSSENATAVLLYQSNYSGFSTTGTAREAGFVSARGSALTNVSLNAALIFYHGSNASTVLESGHPYQNNQNVTYSISRPGFDRIALHFVNISVENFYDQVTIEYPNGTVVKTYTDAKIDFWTPLLWGDGVVVRLVSDSSIVNYGFYADLVANDTEQVFQTCNKVIGGYDVYNNDDDPFDDNFHGTHVAGIAAGNGSIQGVAPGAKLVAVKALSASGTGSESNVVAGIAWCNDHKDEYNISVISMSLGGGAYSDYCDEYASSSALNIAVANGSFAAISSGNDYSSSKISRPACASNALPVGSVSKTDVVSDFSNAWSKMMVLAPGENINSSFPNNATSSISGTSMAAPHVAGAAALLLQLANLSNGTLLSPFELQDLFNKTGIGVNDSRNGLTYYRINVLAAANDFISRVVPRNLSVVSQTNESIIRGDSVFLNLSFIDDQFPISCAIQWYNTSLQQQLMDRFDGYCSTTVLHQGPNTLNFTLQVADPFFNAVNTSHTVVLQSVLENIQINLSNQSFFGAGSLDLNISFNATAADTCVLSVNNTNYSAPASTESCLVPFVPLEGQNDVIAFVNDSYGKQNQSGVYSFTYDSVAPTFVSVGSFTNGISDNDQVVSNVTYLYFSLNLSDASSNVSSCWFIHPNTGVNTSANLSPITGLKKQLCEANITGISEGPHNMTIFWNDSANNVQNYVGWNNHVFYFSVDSVSPTSLLLSNNSAQNNSWVTDNVVLINLSFIEINPSTCIVSYQNASGTSNYTVAPQNGSCSLNVSNNFTNQGQNHNFTVFVNDTAGNMNASGPYSVSYDSVSPSFFSIYLYGSQDYRDGVYTRLNYTYIYVHIESESNLNSCILEYANATGISNYSMEISHSTFPGSICILNVTGNFTNESSETHWFSIYATDLAGNMNQSLYNHSPYFVTYDTIPPSSLDLVFPNLSHSFTRSNYTFVNFTFVDENPDVCILQYQNVFETVNYSMIKSGSNCWFNVTGNFSTGQPETHNFSIYVNDSAGNVNVSGPYSVAYDSFAPSYFGIFSPAGDYTNYNRAFTSLNYTHVDVYVGDEPNLFSCILEYTNATDTTNYSMNLSGQQCSFNVTANFTNASGETHAFSVYAIDAAGNMNRSLFNGSEYLITHDSVAAANLSFVEPTPLNNSLFSGNLSVNLTFVESNPLSCALVLNQTNTTIFQVDLLDSNASSCFFNTSLKEGAFNYSVYVQDVYTRVYSDARFGVQDSEAPNQSDLSALNTSSGYVYLNWTASDSVGVSYIELYRNGSLLNSLIGFTNYTDRNVTVGRTYDYFMIVFDAANHSNVSTDVFVFVNDTAVPRTVSNLSAENLPDGSVNLSWDPVDVDIFGEPEGNVTYFVYRGEESAFNASHVFTFDFISLADSVSNLSLLANTTSNQYVDASVISSNTNYTYAVLAADANANMNSSVSLNNSVNQTTAATCASSFSGFSSCTGGSQSRFRICFGVTQVETQSCTVSTGDSGASSSSGAAAVGGGGGGSSGGSTGGATGGGGGAAGSGNQVFIVQGIPSRLTLDAARSNTLFNISSFYTGYLRYLNISLQGLPSDWYTVEVPDVVSPLGKTGFVIRWHIPQGASGEKPVVLLLSGVGTKTAGKLNTNYSFTLDVGPVQSVQAESPVQVDAARVENIPEPVPGSITGAVTGSAADSIIGVLAAVGLVALAAFGYRRFK